MNRLVADASFCGAWILPDEHSEPAEKVLNEILDDNCELWVPGLWYYEMLNMLASGFRRNRITVSDLREATILLGRVPVRNADIPGMLSMERLMQLAVRFDLSAYDAAYLELGDRLQAPLYTADKKLKAAAGELTLPTTGS